MLVPWAPARAAWRRTLGSVIRRAIPGTETMVLREDGTPGLTLQSGRVHKDAVLARVKEIATKEEADAKGVATNLGIRTQTIPIEPAHAAFLDMLAEPFAGAYR